MMDFLRPCFLFFHAVLSDGRSIDVRWPLYGRPTAVRCCRCPTAITDSGGENYCEAFDVSQMKDLVMTIKMDTGSSKSELSFTTFGIFKV